MSGEQKAGRGEVPTVRVTLDEPALPCCGASADEQAWCSTLGMPHLVVCSCGAAWAYDRHDYDDEGDDGIILAAAREARCTGKTNVGDARIWWED